MSFADDNFLSLNQDTNWFFDIGGGLNQSTKYFIQLSKILPIKITEIH